MYLFCVFLAKGGGIELRSIPPPATGGIDFIDP